MTVGTFAWLNTGLFDLKRPLLISQFLPMAAESVAALTPETVAALGPATSWAPWY